MTRQHRFAALLGLAALLAPAPPARGDDAPALTQRATGDLAIQARAVLRKYCAECHGDAQPRGRLAVGDHKTLVSPQPPVPFVNLRDPARSQVIEFIEDGSMPPGGRARPTPEELATLKQWVAAQAPGYPRAFDDKTTLALVLDNWAEQKPADQPFLRYVSFGHLVRDDEPLPNLGAAEVALQKALLAASGKSVAPVQVDSARTLFRLDTRTLGWETPDLFDRVEKGVARPDAYPMVPFDLILLEYPHGSAAPAKDDARLPAFLKTTKQLRPVPFLRGDWLSRSLAPGAPLADDLRSLVDLAAAKAKNPDASPCGPVVRPFAAGGLASRITAPVVAGRSPLPPLSARYLGSFGPTPDPLGVKVEAVRILKGNAPTFEVEEGEKFRLRVTADRDVRCLLLVVLATGDVRVQPLATANEGNLVKPGTSALFGPKPNTPFEAGGILTGGDSEVEHYVLIAAEQEVPVPTIVRSRHADAFDCPGKNQAPIWRFVFEKPPDGATVRKVVPLTVRKKP
jgi:mono/diheme cytochrome c family protein